MENIVSYTHLAKLVEQLQRGAHIERKADRFFIGWTSNKSLISEAAVTELYQRELVLADGGRLWLNPAGYEAFVYDLAWHTVGLIDRTLPPGRTVPTAIWQDTDGRLLETLDQVMAAHAAGKLLDGKYEAKLADEKRYPTQPAAKPVQLSAVAA